MRRASGRGQRSEHGASGWGVSGSGPGRGGQPGEYTAFSGVFGTMPALGTSTFVRDHEIRVIGWQYTNQEGDVPPNTPTVELWLQKGGFGETALLLTVEDARALASMLTSAFEAMEAGR